MSVAEGKDVVVNSIADDVWGSEYEVTVVLIDKFDSWYWLYFSIPPMSIPMKNSKTNNIKW